MNHQPLVSIITPVYDTDAGVLAECIESVHDQTYSHWQLVLIDDASPGAHVWPQLQAAASEPRVIAQRRDHNGGIVAASNDGLVAATGEIVVLLDHDDRLHPQALERVVMAFRSHPEVDYVYSDEDVLSPEGERVSPFFKPDWSPERFRTQMYTCHLSAIRASLVDEVGGFRDGFDGAQDWDLILRVTERARKVVHIPHVLYHWRVVPSSVLAGEDVKPYAYSAGRRAVEAHCERLGMSVEVDELKPAGYFRVRRVLDEHPMVSIVIPTRGSTGVVLGAERTFVVEAVRSVCERSTYENFEIVVVADDEMDDATRDALDVIAGDRLVLVPFDEPFNFSRKCNVGARHAVGELLLFLNDDTEVIDDDWIETLVGFALESDVGAAGAQLLFEDGRVQHAGHVYLDGNPGHLMFGRLPHEDANRMALRIDREVSGVTAAAMLCRREVFEEVGGFSELFANNYNDVDFCCKVRSLGYRIVVSAHARLHHYESVSRDATVSDEELALVRARWGQDLWNDPFYNPNFDEGLDCWPEPIRYP